MHFYNIAEQAIKFVTCTAHFEAIQKLFIVAMWHWSTTWLPKLNWDLVVPYLQNKLNGFFCLNLPVVRQRKPVVQRPTSQIFESTSSAEDSHGANRGPVTTHLRCSYSAPQISKSASSGQGGADDDCHDPNNGQATNSVRSSYPTSQISESSSSAQDSRGTDNGRVLTHPRRSNSASQISNSASSGQGGADDSHDPNNDQATNYVRSSYSTPQFHISKSARSGQDGHIAGNGQDTTPQVRIYHLQLFLFQFISKHLQN